MLSELVNRQNNARHACGAPYMIFSDPRRLWSTRDTRGCSSACQCSAAAADRPARQLGGPALLCSAAGLLRCSIAVLISAFLGTVDHGSSGI
eukprot:1583925-Pleurochrysis_carterae.AAC.2